MSPAGATGDRHVVADRDGVSSAVDVQADAAVTAAAGIVHLVVAALAPLTAGGIVAHGGRARAPREDEAEAARAATAGTEIRRVAVATIGAGVGLGGINREDRAMRTAGTTFLGALRYGGGVGSAARTADRTRAAAAGTG